MKDLDAILTSTPNGADINLDPCSIYTSRAFGGTTGARIPPGSTLFGRGATIQIDANRQDSDLNCLCGGPDSRVFDVVLDCNGKVGMPFKRNGLVIEGGKQFARNVKVVRSYGIAETRKEAFAFYLRGGANTQLTDCVASDFVGTYSAACNVDTGTVSGFRAIFPSVIPDGAMFTGLNFGDARELVYTDCYIVNARVGFYSDTGDTHNIACQNSVFMDCEVACELKHNSPTPPTTDGIIFVNNFCTLRPESTSALRIHQETPGKMRDLNFVKNVFQGPSISSNGNPLWLLNIGCNPDSVSDIRLEMNSCPQSWQLRNRDRNAQHIRIVREVEGDWVTV